ncbi:hypothetical protein N9J72_00690 [Candidatus Gracilibacteria bacterium]|nr:hypothetical protein [Candidatus Gracilibacteria bacterium]
MEENCIGQAFFYSKKFNIYSSKITQEKVIEVSNFLYAADLDYLTARKLFLDGRIFYFPALTYFQQAFEKYLKFISYFIFEKKKENLHHSKSQFMNNGFVSCIPEHDVKIIKELLDNFTNYRYLDKDFSIDILKVLSIIDRFVFEFYKTIANLGIVGFCSFQDKINMKLGLGGLPTNIIYHIIIYRDSKEREEIIDIRILKKENRFFNDMCKVLDKNFKKPIPITLNASNIFIRTGKK